MNNMGDFDITRRSLFKAFLVTAAVAAVPESLQSLIPEAVTEPVAKLDIANWEVWVSPHGKRDFKLLGISRSINISHPVERYEVFSVPGIYQPIRGRREPPTVNTTLLVDEKGYRNLHDTFHNAMQFDLGPNSNPHTDTYIRIPYQEKHHVIKLERTFIKYLGDLSFDDKPAPNLFEVGVEWIPDRVISLGETKRGIIAV